MAEDKREGNSPLIPLAVCASVLVFELLRLTWISGLQHRPAAWAPDVVRWFIDLLESLAAMLTWRAVAESLRDGTQGAKRIPGGVALAVMFTMALATLSAVGLAFPSDGSTSAATRGILPHFVAVLAFCAALGLGMDWLVRAQRLRRELTGKDLDRLVIHGAIGSIVYLCALAALTASGYFERKADLASIERVGYQLGRVESQVQQVTVLCLSAGQRTSARELTSAVDALRVQGEALEGDLGLASRVAPGSEALIKDVDRVAGGVRRIVMTLGSAYAGVPDAGFFVADPENVRWLLRETEGLVGLSAGVTRRIGAMLQETRDDASFELTLVAVSISLFATALLLGMVLPIAKVLRQLALVARYTQHPALICDVRRRIVWANEAFSRLSGYSLEESIGQTPGRLRQCPETDPKAIARIREALVAQRGVRTEILNSTKDGRRQWVDLDIQPVRGPWGRLDGFIGVEIDVTKRVQLTRYLQTLLDAVGSAVVVLDEMGAIVDCNAEAERVFERRRAEMLGHSFESGGWRFLGEEGQALAPKNLPCASCRRSGQAVRNAVVGIDSGRGRPRWLQANAVPMAERGHGDASVVASFIDITERREMEDRLHREARLDSLTGLANRTMFMEWLEDAMAMARLGNATRFAILLLDFDRFKLINDSLGHEAGDELLRQIGERLRQALRDDSETGGGRVGDRIARFGGDEFVALVRDVQSPEDAERIADRVLEAMKSPYEVKGIRLYCSASIGVYVSGLLTASGEEALRGADTAMYEAKRAGGRTKVVFRDTMQVRVARTLAIENALRDAKSKGELRLVYQPIVDLESGSLQAVEALLRWDSVQFGPISPAEFVPIAEESGLIFPLGEWVLWEACRQMAVWRREAPDYAPAVMSVNVSRVQLNSPERLLSLIRDVLRETQLEPQMLQVELTERELMKDLETTRALIDELRGTGVKLAMDDFGTGASSLGCLCDLKFDVIKIDRSFVRDLEHNSGLLAIAHATVMMLSNLGLKSVAEGIETAAQLAILQATGCDSGQGYLFGRPVPPTEVLRSFSQSSVTKDSGRY